MKEIDRMIREALREEDAALYESVGGEQAVHQIVFDIFRGKSRWLVVTSIIIGVVFMALAVVSAWRFYQAEQMREMLIWGAGCFFCLAAVTAMKIWFWMEMSKNAVTREIKRLELQLAHVARAIAQLSAPDRIEK